MKDYLQRIEVIVFSSPNGISIEELSNRLKLPPELVDHYVRQLIKRYSDPQFGIEVVKEGDLIKMKVKATYAELVSGKPELGRGVLMTLSLIAVSSPIKLSDLVRKRGTIAREHVKKLKELGMVSVGEENGKKIVRLAPGFFEYFDISKEELESLRKEFEQTNNQATQ
jgi:segregation and condensation protein B